MKEAVTARPIERLPHERLPIERLRNERLPGEDSALLLRSNFGRLALSVAALFVLSACANGRGAGETVLPVVVEGVRSDDVPAAGIDPSGTSGALVGELADDFPRSRIVALDFVDAMNSVPALAPERTTLYTRLPDTRFAEILVSALQNAGYRLQLGDESAGEGLDYVVRANAGSGGGDYTFEVKAGQVHLKRSYRVDDDGIAPTSIMMMRLATQQDQTLDTLRAEGLDSSSTGASVQPRQRLPGGESDSTRNMYESGVSQFEDFLADYATLSRDVMVFPNDSLFMGEANKRLTRDIVDRFDVDNDVISLIGCSHGRTALTNGNETLALGRASRVREEFQLAGVEADRVLDEGCWANQYFDPLPRRGVVVIHKRLIDEAPGTHAPGTR